MLHTLISMSRLGHNMAKSPVKHGDTAKTPAQVRACPNLSLG